MESGEGAGVDVEGDKADREEELSGEDGVYFFDEVVPGAFAEVGGALVGVLVHGESLLQ